ncbi:MAG: twin-arginine translocation signal domain-containing protein [Candidatus Limnocylindria bacterium]
MSDLSRRQFLASSTAAAAAVTIGAPSSTPRSGAGRCGSSPTPTSRSWIPSGPRPTSRATTAT